MGAVYSEPALGQDLGRRQVRKTSVGQCRFLPKVAPCSRGREYQRLRTFHHQKEGEPPPSLNQRRRRERRRWTFRADTSPYQPNSTRLNSNPEHYRRWICSGSNTCIYLLSSLYRRSAIHECVSHWPEILPLPANMANLASILDLQMLHPRPRDQSPHSPPAKLDWVGGFRLSQQNGSEKQVQDVLDIDACTRKTGS